MKKLILLVTAIVSLGLVAAPKPAEKESLKVLMIGNSFSICLLNELPPVAKSLNKSLDIASLYIGGCTLYTHWNNVVASTNATFKPYRFDRTVNNVAVVKASTINIPEALTLEKWDVITIQQGSHDSWRPATYHPYGDLLLAKIHALAPQAKVYLQETWSYTPFDGRLAKWGIDQNEMYAKLHEAYGAFAKANKLPVLPMGTAVQAWRRELPVKYGEMDLGGDVVGSLTFSKDDAGKISFTGDPFHLNGKGHYLQALVWAAKLYNVDVTKCAYAPKCVPPAEAKLMKSIALRTVVGSCGK